MSTFKTLVLAAATAAAVSPAMAEGGGLSFNVGMVSSYADDGRDAEGVRPALQFGVDYDFGNGFYVGNFNTTGKFGDELKANLEVNLYAGYANELANGVFYDVNITRYQFQNQKSWNANELNLTMGYGPVSATYSRYFDDHGFYDPQTLGVAVSHSLNEKLGLSLTVEKTQGTSALDYELGAAYDFGDGLTGTAAIAKYKPKVVLGLSKTF